MPSTLRIDGLTQLQAALRALPDHLVSEAAVIVTAQAETASDLIGAAYPTRTGRLRRGLQVQAYGNRASATAVVRSRAPHAHLYEFGTGARRWANGKQTGTMPAARVFIPIAIQRRKIMLAALVDLVRRAGLDVTE